MFTQMKVIDAGEMEVELTVRMKLDSWKTLRKQMTRSISPSSALSNPICVLRDDIDSLIHQMQIHFYPEVKE